MTPKIRLFIAAPLAAATTIEPGPAQSHYLLTVMRRQAGDQVALFNGQDGEWLATLEPTGRRRCRLRIADQLRPQEPEPGPALLFAPLKRIRQEMLVEKATELGAAALEPLITRRSVVDRLNRERLRNVAIEAAEQCGRLSVPEIGPPLPFVAALEGWPAGRRLYVADETGGGRPLLEALREHGAGDLLVGPEGGFEPDELDTLQAREGVVAVGLGRRILRAETAALAALACWQAVLATG
jgi:16S rRNA (uracil1498-N3)-methyltransferase